MRVKSDLHRSFYFSNKVESLFTASIPETHRRQVEAVGRQVVGGLRQFFGGLDELAAADDVRVRVVNGHVEAQRLQQDVLVHHQLLSLFVIRFRSERWKEHIFKLSVKFSFSSIRLSDD